MQISNFRSVECSKGNFIFVLSLFPRVPPGMNHLHGATFLGVMVLTLFGGQLRAASLTFGSPTNFAGDTDVWTAGSLNYAQNASLDTSVLLNGVTFTAAGSSEVGDVNAWNGGNIVVTRDTGSPLAVNVASSATSYPAAMSSNYQSLLAFRTNGGNTSTVTLSNLTSGRAYVVQAWSQFPTHDGHTTWSNVAGTGPTTTAPAAAPILVGQKDLGYVGQYFIGGFTADGASQFIYQKCTVGTATNAIQVRDVTGYWSGQVDGNWDSSTGNFTGFNGGTNGAPSTTTGMAFNSSGITAVDRVTFADLNGFAGNVSNKDISVQSNGVSIGTVVFENNTSNYTFTNASGTTGISGATAVVHDGAGRVVFNSANTYGGGTTVNSGTLVVNNTTGSGTGTGTVTIAYGARLEGSGIITGETTISGTHAPGNSPGTQTFTGGLNYTSSGVFDWELTSSTTEGRGTNWDAVNLTTGGTLTVDPDAVFKLVLTNVDFDDSFWDSTQTWSVFTATSPATITSVFQNFQVTGGTNYNASLGSFSMTGDGSLKWSAVPEPSSALAAVLLTAGLLRRSRNPSGKSAVPEHGW